MSAVGHADVADPRMVAAIALIGHTGAAEFQIRYDDDPEPVVWVANVKYEESYEAAGGMTPLTATLRLAALLIDGGTCVHCRRMTMIEHDWRENVIFAKEVCWRQYDPELKTYRRSCEGDVEEAPRIGRNDPCPCGSGEKYKRCHGR